MEDCSTVSVIIVNLNGKNWLEKCIPSILSSDYPKDKIEIILVDNGSTDGSIEFAKKLLERELVKFKIIQNKENKGWSPANNQGAEESKGDILLFLSNDMEVDKNWIKEIVKIFRLDHKAGVIQCNSLSMWDKNTFDSAMNYLDRYGFAYSYAPQENPWKVFFAEGMAFAIRRDVFEKIGGFDEYYFMEYDDMDLCWRVRLAGYQVYFDPKSIVYHARGGTVGGTYFKRKIRNIVQYVRNHYVTLIKNYELKNLIPALFIVSAMQFTKISYFIVKREFKLANATIRGMVEVIKDFRLILEKRKNVQQKIRKVPDKEIMKYMHPFKPILLYKFMVLQKNEKKFIINSEPPIKEWEMKYEKN